MASPGNKDYDNEAKIVEYRKVGVNLVWIIHPLSRRVNVFPPETGLRPQSFLGTDELDGEGVIPGFKLNVSTIFDYPVDLNPEAEII